MTNNNKLLPPMTKVLVKTIFKKYSDPYGMENRVILEEWHKGRDVMKDSLYFILCHHLSDYRYKKDLYNIIYHGDVNYTELKEPWWKEENQNNMENIL